MSQNRLIELWGSGGAAYGAWCAIPAAVSAEAVGMVGFDYVCVDMQHGLIDYQTAVTMLQAIDRGSSTPISRVPWNEPGIIGKILDAGARGVIIPMVNSVAEAEAAVAACRYPPDGARSYGPARALMSVGADYYEHANRTNACIPMIETMQAVEAIDDILAVPGIDAVYMGPSDLSVSMGMAPGNYDDHDEWRGALEAVVAACERHGVVAGIHANAALTPRRMEMGFRMVTVQSDLLAVKAMSRDLAAAKGASGAADSGSAY